MAIDIQACMKEFRSKLVEINNKLLQFAEADKDNVEKEEKAEREEQAKVEKKEDKAEPSDVKKEEKKDFAEEVNEHISKQFSEHEDRISKVEGAVKEMSESLGNVVELCSKFSKK